MQAGRCPDALYKLRFIVPHIPAHALDSGKNGGFHFRGGNVVHGAVAGQLAVVGTDESVLNPFPLHKVVAVGQLCAAIGAIEKPGQAVGGVLPLGSAALGFPYLLYGAPCFFVHNGGDSSVKMILFLRRGLAAALGLVILAYGLS